MLGFWKNATWVRPVRTERAAPGRPPARKAVMKHQETFRPTLNTTW